MLLWLTWLFRVGLRTLNARSDRIRSGQANSAKKRSSVVSLLIVLIVYNTNRFLSGSTRDRRRCRMRRQSFTIREKDEGRITWRPAPVTGPRTIRAHDY